MIMEIFLGLALFYLVFAALSVIIRAIAHACR